MRRCSVLAAALFWVGCGGGDGDDDPFGIPRRVVVSGLAFPTGLSEPAPLDAVAAFPNLDFDRPVFMTHAPDGTDRLFVVEVAGVIRVFANDPAVSSTTVFLDIRGRVSSGGEEGLLGLAFHPDHAANGFFYVYYSVSSPRRTRLSRFEVTADPDVANAGSESILLEIAQPFSNHNGGMIAFGPDGMLYVASGDGGSGGDPDNNAQDLTNLLGKVLRLDPSGGVPADNPFVGMGAGVRGEIWAYGLRNPWRFSFDRDTGTLWLGDVGQGAVEEVDIIERGKNYGWRLFEGDRVFNNPTGEPAEDFAAPVIAYPHSEGFSVTGGYVYRGSELPSLAGAYVYGDYGSDRIWALVHDGSQVVSNTEIASITNPSSFGEDTHGELYVCSLGGTIYRFEERGAGEEPPEFPEVLSESGLFTDTADLTPAPGLIEYEVNSPLWSDRARKRRWMALPGTSRITFRATGPWDFAVGAVFVKHFELEVAPGTFERLETRVLVRHESGWQGYTYRWNGAQNDANLLTDAATATIPVEDAGAPGGVRDQTWYFPSRSDCLACHTQAAGRILGVHTRQLNRDFAYDQVVDNQLRAWNHIGLFDASIGGHGAYGLLPEPADASRSLAERARSYLEANCANCHRPGGPTPVDLDLRFDTPRDEMRAIDVPSVAGPDAGTPRIAPGDSAGSVLWLRLWRLDGFRMPPLSSNEVDRDGEQILGAWIDAGAPVR